MTQSKLHTVEQFVLDADYYEVESARQAQSRISNLASSKLVSVFERVCDRYGEDIIYQMRKVHLDLGDIPEDILENELVLRFENRLISILEAIKRGDHIVGGVEGFEIKRTDESLIEGLIYYLNNGTLPYYVEHALGNKSVKELFYRIQEAKIPVFQKELRNSATSLMAKKRIASLFPGNELLQFFHIVLPEKVSQPFNEVFDDFILLVKTSPIDNTKNELILLCREFFIHEALSNSFVGMSFNSIEVLPRFLIFLENEKNVLPEKWMPGILVHKSSNGELNKKLSKLVERTSEYYIAYLNDSKSSMQLRFTNDIFQKQNQVMEMKELAEKETIHVKSQLNLFVKKLVSEVKHFYKSVEEERIETVIMGITDEILPTKNVNVENFEYWADAISSEVKRLFGVALETQHYNSSGYDQKNDTIVSNQKTEEHQKVNSSVAVAYWAMFLAAGITPFEKLYSKPKSKLKAIFTELVKKEPDSAVWQIKQHVNEQNVMIIAWWFHETLGAELLQFYKSNLHYNQATRLEIDFSYSSVLASVFFATGNFPWPELNNHGHKELIQFVNEFILDSDDYLLEQFAFQNKLFDNVAKLEKVLSMVDIIAAKKLVQIRINLVEKGLINKKFFSKKKVRSTDSLSLDLNVSGSSSSIKDIEDIPAQAKSSVQSEDIETENGEDSIRKSQSNRRSTDKEIVSENTLTELEKQILYDKKKVDGSIENVDQYLSDQEELALKSADASLLDQEEVKVESFIKQECERWTSLSSSKLLDEIAYDILHFIGTSFYDSISLKDRAELIFQKISASAGRSYYQTAAMLVDLPRKEISQLLEQFSFEQRDYIKKLVKSYRSRFVSMAEDIRRAEEETIAQKGLEHLDEDQTLFVKNAGIVLLNPYLMRLFKRFELIEGKDFVDNSAKEKGVHLLQYLVTKGTDAEEFELSLNKIICGIPLGVPLKEEVSLSDDDMKICDGLLEAMVKNWGALKNTSADGLRTSFLMREGTLRKEATGWKLNIEKKVYDILLDKLPWGYSMIQLPWMEMPLHTEWEGK